MKRAVALLAALVLGGCSSAQESSVVGPSGRQMHIAKCNQSPTACYKSASDTCSGPYRVLDSYSKAGGLVADAMAGPVTWYYMTYECGQGDGVTPTFAFRGQQYVPAPVSAPKTTNCNAVGNSLMCQSY